MPRRRVIERRELQPDQKYNNRLVARFINNLFTRGKKSTAESYSLRGFLLLSREENGSPSAWSRELLKSGPRVESECAGWEVRPIGPDRIHAERRMALGIKWIIGHARKRTEKTMKEKLAAELIDAYNNRGASVKKREDVHKMAEANRAFAHYRF